MKLRASKAMIIQVKENGHPQLSMLPDALSVLNHLAQHLIINKYLAINIELVILEETAFLGVCFSYL